MPMTTAPGRGYGRIPYGRGLYGRAMTIAGDADAEIVPADLDLQAQELGGSSGVSAVIEVAEVDIETGEALGLVPPNVPIPAGRIR